MTHNSSLSPATADDPWNDGSRLFGGAWLDFRYGLGTGKALVGAINPDFGQVEVDPAVVNLTAFKTFFEEKRPFFTEGSQVFLRFGRSGASEYTTYFYPEPQLFYSRRVGRAPQGSATGAYVDAPTSTTILGAAKLVGRTKSGWNLGFLDAVTGRELTDEERKAVEKLTAETQGFDANKIQGAVQHMVPVLVPDITDRLDELGGRPCRDDFEFICVTITVPLDHFDPANPETIDVVFAVAPATGERKGMYVQAFPGGPGGEGIVSASRDYFPLTVQERYDLVFFDQRGVGLSNPLECEETYAGYFLQYLNTDDNTGEEGYDTPAEQQNAIQTAKTFVDDCINEIGIDLGRLKFFTTSQYDESRDATEPAPPSSSP